MNSVEPSQLRSTLEQLDTQLTQTTAQEPERAAALQAVHGQVQQLLNLPETALPEHQHSFLEQLRAMIPSLEATHADLTVAMSQVIDMLDRMGL